MRAGGSNVFALNIEINSSSSKKLIMKKIRRFLTVVLLFSFTFINAQTREEKEKIISATDVEKLNELKAQFEIEFLERQNRIDNYLKSNPTPRRFTVDGVEKEIYDVDNSGTISYSETSNFGSSITIGANRLYNGGSLGLNLQGQGMTAGVWDSGPALETHVEFPGSRVSVRDFTDYTDHGTHVVGTVLASGTNANARGIAFQANGNTFDWNNDYAEMALEASQGLLVSNHSYYSGSSGAWVFGAYDSRAQQMDQITHAAPFYLPVVSAGNDRNNTSVPVTMAQNQNKFGYDLIRGMHNAKNSLVVGAVVNLPNYVNASSVQMSNFSSWGPTDDGRIKPEVVAQGVNVLSSIATSTTSYASYQGTSMSAPAVAGSCLLLQQHYNNLFSNYMRSSTMKGLLMHSAREAGFFDGPDYEFGWGLVDNAGAATIISAKNTETAVIDELILNNNATYTRTFSVSNPSSVRVSISWTDPAPTFFNNTAAVDPDISYLVNDLDLKVTKDNVTNFPWSLNKVAPFDGPTRTTTNNVDIFERVDLDNASGLYSVTVSHKGALVGAGQRFTLIISGANLGNLSNNDFAVTEKNILLYPNPANDILNYTILEDASFDDITVTDVFGKLILSKKSGSGTNQIDVSYLQSGIYFVKFSNSRGAVVKKFIKK
jgi:hypothetical protein